jgi:hypothetical protein
MRAVVPSNPVPTDDDAWAFARTYGKEEPEASCTSWKQAARALLPAGFQPVAHLLSRAERPQFLYVQFILDAVHSDIPITKVKLTREMRDLLAGLDRACCAEMRVQDRSLHALLSPIDTLPRELFVAALNSDTYRRWAVCKLLQNLLDAA